MSRARPHIDRDALRKKYAAERDKRLRPDGNAQYIRIENRLAHYLDDPYTPRKERAPVHDHVTFAFIGGGFAGLVTGARLRETDDIVALQRRRNGGELDRGRIGDRKRIERFENGL